jgi:hypothetical protein
VTPDQQSRALALLHRGTPQSVVALALGVTKNVVAGLWARRGSPVSTIPASTLHTRCDALDAAMDAVLRETLAVPRIPNAPKLQK